MKISSLISDLEQSGVSIQLQQDTLKIQAPKGKISDEQLKEIRANKQAIIGFLTEVTQTRSLTDIKPVEQRAYYDLSHAQKRLWVFSKLYPESAAYNMPAAYHLTGDFDRQAFQAAFKVLVDRHESLRTTFLKVDGEPKQKVHPSDRFGFEVGYVDMRGQENPAVQAVIDEEAFRPFNLEEGPLLRAVIIRVDEEQYALVFCIHHIIADEWSLEILVGELLQLQEAYRQHGNCQGVLPPLKIQYKDYAAWQNDEVTSSAFDKYRKYWKGVFDDAVPTLDLPIDFPRPATKTYNGSSVQFNLSESQTELLKEICQRQNVSLFMCLTAVIKSLLYHYTGQEDVVIGAPVAGRDHPDLANQIGFYVNMVALRTNFSSDESFEKLLSRVKETVLGAFSHMDYPFDCLVEDLNLNSDEKTALFDIGFAWHAKAMSASFSPDVAYKVDKRELSSTMAKYDLFFHGQEQQNTISFTIEYNTDLFASSRITSIAEHFTFLLESLDQNFSVPLNKLAYMRPEERKHVLEEFNATQKDFPREKTIQQLFEDQVARTPDAIAVTYRDTVLTYSQLNSEANKLAHHLRACYQVGADDIIGLMVGRSERAIVGILGILKAGGAYLPIVPGHPKERARYMLADAGVKTLLSEPEYVYDIIDFFEGNLVMLDTQFSSLVVSSENPSHENQATDLAYVIYTSGSTGSPKGVAVEHTSYINMCLDQIERYQVTKSDKVLQFASLSFDASIFEIFLSLLSGASLSMIDQEVINHADQFTEFVQKQGVTLTLLPPVYLNGLELEKLETLRVLITGGERPNVQDALRCSRFSTYFNAYGPTEGSVIASVQPVSGDEDRKLPIAIGNPIANMQMYILNDKLQAVGIGIIGEICLSGPSLARGYIGQEELTKQKFVSHPFIAGERLYRTGDLGKRRPDGSIELLGREDSQVKIRGFRIELGEIENVMREHKAIKEALVISQQSQNGDKKLVAYYTASAVIDPHHLRAYLQDYLPSYMIPSYFMPLDSFPITHSGKIDIEQLPEPEDIATSKQYVPPQTTTEKQLAAIWERLLGKERLSTNDNFFARGGDSIKAIRIVSAVKKEMERTINITDIFDHQDIRSLAAVLDSTTDDTQRAHSEAAYQQVVEELDRFKEDVLRNPNFSRLVTSKWEDIYPMSDIEEGMVFHSLLGDAYYFEQIYYRIQDDSFNHALFIQAFEALVQKHEKLRTGFYMNELGAPTQIVFECSSLNLDIKPKDFSTIPEEKQEEALKEYLKRERTIPFDLKEPGLWRLRIIDFGKCEYGILFIIHHAIIDGWSNASLVTELSNVYVGLKEDPTYALSPLKMTYKDYIIDQMLLKSSEDIGNFWKTYLAGYERTDVPLNKTLSTQPIEEDPELLFVSLEDQLSNALIARASQLNVNVKDLFLAAFTYLLKLTTNSNEVVFGLVTNGRPAQEDGDKIVGCFLNSVPFRFKIASDITGEELVNQVAKSSHPLKSYDKLPLIRIANLVEKESAHQSPIYDILLNYTDFHITQDAHKDIILKDASIFEKINTAFNIIVIRSGDQIGFRLNYSYALYTAEEIERIGNYLKRLLEQIAYTPQAPITPRQILTANEEKLLFNDFMGRNRVDTNRTVHELFEAQAAQTPHNTAVVFEDCSLTYQDLNETANRLAHYLRSTYAIEPDTLVGVMLSRSEKMVIALLAILKAGAGYVPLESSFPTERKKMILDDGDIDLLLTESALMFDVAEYYDGDLFALDIQLETLPNCIHNLPKISSYHHLAYVMYTSGSTGTPKGVMVEHKNIVRLVNNEAVVKTDASHRLLQTGALSFDASTFEIWGMLLKGGELHFLSQEKLLSIEDLKTKMRDDKITTVWFTSSWFNRLADTDISVFASLTHLIVGGEQLSPSHIQKVRKAFPSLTMINGYGPTEGVTFTTFYDIKDDVDFTSSIPIGSPLDNTTVLILDDDLKPVPLGTTGEMYIGGDGVARGYLNQKELTAEKFLRIDALSDTPLYKTGDLGKWRAGGHLEFRGRKDRQVKIRGYRIELGEIEHVMSQYDDLAQVHSRLVSKNKEIAAFYTLKSGGTDEHLASYLEGKLPAFMVPTHLIRLENMSLSRNGKIDSAQLPDVDELERGAQNVYVPPRNATEEKLLAIWQRVLDKDKIGVRDSFFNLGGHSLRATQVMYYIHQAFSKKILLNDIFNYPTIEQLAQAILTYDKEDFQEILPVEDKKYHDLSHAQKRLWLLTQAEDNQVAYNMPMAFILEGELDQLALEESFRALMAKHEVLRTVFVTEAGEPKQKILVEEELGFKLQYADLRAENDQELRIKQQLSKESHRVFNLEKGPLISVSLLQLASCKYAFLCNMHHIISDGWSMGVLINEITSFYNTYKQHRKIVYDPLAINYKDYAAWQNEQLAESHLNTHRQYWLTQFDDSIPTLDLPTDYERPSEKTYEGNYVGFEIDAQQSTALYDMSQEVSASLFMTLLACTKILLYKCSGQRDIVVGTPTVGREHAALEDQIGFYLNTLALRTKLRGEERFIDLLARVKNTALKAYEHQMYPYDQLIEDLNLEIERNRSPLFDVMVVLNNMDYNVQNTSVFEGLKVSQFGNETDHKVSKYDLSFFFKEHDGKILGNINYDTRLFRKETVCQFKEYLMRIIASLAQNKDITIAEMDWTGVAEEEKFNAFVS